MNIQFINMKFFIALTFLVTIAAAIPAFNGGLNNGWNLIMENITCGDGNHE